RRRHTRCYRDWSSDVCSSDLESPLKKDMLWAGTDDGLVYLSLNGGQSWTNVTPKDLPEWSMISIIESSHHDPGTAYLAVDRHKQIGRASCREGVEAATESGTK